MYHSVTLCQKEDKFVGREVNMISDVVIKREMKACAPDLHFMKVYWGQEGKEPLILNVGN
jgi:hypothetical protein